MLPLLLRLRSLGWRGALGLGLAGGLVALALTCWRQRLELGKLRLAYEHPKVVEVVRTVRVEGPTRVVTRVVREPSGREETTREEVTGPVVTTRDGSRTAEPIFAPAARTSGWVTGVEGAPWRRPLQTRDVALHGGYRFGGRLDVIGRVNLKAEPSLVVLWRW